MGWKDWFRGKPKDERAFEVAVDLISVDGSPELEHLFINVLAVDISRGLDGWKWLPISDLTAVAVSAFGEVFFRDAAGAIHQIDTIEGKLSKVANSLPELAGMFQIVETRDTLLLEGLVLGARKNGLMLEEGECYDFRIAPALGGQMSVSDMEKLSFVVKLHIAGQLHEQIKDLPPGTRINEVTISS